MSRLALIVVLSLPAASGTPTGWATFAIPAEGGMSGLPFQDFGSTGSWTAELWIKMDSDMFTKTIPPFGVMPFGLHEGSNHAGLTMYQAGTGVCGNTCTGGFSPHVWCSGLFPSCICEADTWVHFAAVKDSSANSLTIYRDGVQDTQRSWSGTTCQGAFNDNAGRYLEGAIANMRMWSVARTQTEISTHMDTVSASFASTTGLFAWLPFYGDLVEKVTLTTPTISGGTVVMNAAPGSGATGDPHISFAHGGKADFRGSHRASYVFISSAGYQFAPYFQEVDFNYHGVSGRWQKVHGTFMTKALWRVRAASGRELLIVTEAMGPGETSVLTLPEAARSGEVISLEPSEIAKMPSISLKPWQSRAFDGVHVETRMLSVVVTTALWNVTITSKAIFGLVPPLLNATHVHGRWDEYQRRLDIIIHGAFPQPNAHGIVGQSYRDASVRSGKMDVYAADAALEESAPNAEHTPLPPMTTVAQAEGAIDGVFTDYKLLNVLSTSFRFSHFDDPMDAASVEQTPRSAHGKRTAMRTAYASEWDGAQGGQRAWQVGKKEL